jgi:hypothetical protein
MVKDDRIDARHEILKLANRQIKINRGSGGPERILYMRHLQEAVAILRGNGIAKPDLFIRAGFNSRVTRS